MNTRYIACVPPGGLVSGRDTFVQFCQPPLLATATLPTSRPVGESRRTSMLPPAPPEATRKLIARMSLRLTGSYETQSPFSMKPMFLPPPVSAVSSVWMPDIAVKNSACLRFGGRIASARPVSGALPAAPLSV